MNHDKEQVAMQSVWKRQMKVSAGAVVVGMMLLIYTIPQLRHSGGEPLSHSLVILSIVAGLAVLGGLFSCALALFFHLWHQKSDD